MRVGAPSLGTAPGLPEIIVCPQTREVCTKRKLNESGCPEFGYSPWTSRDHCLSPNSGGLHEEEAAENE